MRNAFSMITAIFVIVLMATVSGLILNVSAKTVKSTTLQYKQEQAILYAKSYTELAIMYATANNPYVNNCAENLNGNIGTSVATGDGYNVQVRIAYIDSLPGSLQCSGTRILNTGAPLTTANERHVIVDAYIRYRDESLNTLWITYHKRTLQRL